MGVEIMWSLSGQFLNGGQEGTGFILEGSVPSRDSVSHSQTPGILLAQLAIASQSSKWWWLFILHSYSCDVTDLVRESFSLMEPEPRGGFLCLPIKCVFPSPPSPSPSVLSLLPSFSLSSSLLSSFPSFPFLERKVWWWAVNKRKLQSLENLITDGAT